MQITKPIVATRTESTQSDRLAICYSLEGNIKAATLFRYHSKVERSFRKGGQNIQNKINYPNSFFFLDSTAKCKGKDGQG